MGRLPAGYQELSYIESTGTQWIDTGIQNNNDNEIGIDFTLKSTTTALFGIATGSGYATNSVSPVNGSFRALKTNAMLNFSLSVGWHTIVVSNANVIIDGSAKAWEGDSGNNLTGTIAIFISVYNSSAYKGSYKLHAFYIKSGTNKIRDFIPAKRLSDGAIGMFDLVSQSFFGNSGTGSFIAGAPIIEPTWGSGLAQVTQKEMLARRSIMPRKLWLYRNGVQYVPLEFAKITGTNGISYAVNEDNLELKRVGNGGWNQAGFTTPLVNVFGHSKIFYTVNVSAPDMDKNNLVKFGVGISQEKTGGNYTKKNDFYYSFSQPLWSDGYRTLSLDIDGLGGSFYIQFYIDNAARVSDYKPVRLCSCMLKELWLE